MAKARRYAQRWRGRVPASPLTGQYLKLAVPDAVRMHRRIAVGGHGPLRRASAIPLQAWLELRWLTRGASQEIASALAHAGLHYEAATGMGLDEQQRALRHLAIAHAITPGEAYDFDLVGHPDDWAQYVFDRESGWNPAVSQPQAQSWVVLLSDKYLAGQWLGRLGIPTPEVELVEPGRASEVDLLAAAWLARWGAVVGKPRSGSGGDGVFELLPTDDGGFVTTHYQWRRPVDDAGGRVAELLAASDYVVQPRLLSHELFDHVADHRRVVVLRLVTRDAGSGPELFSACVEVALPMTGDTAFVAHVSVGADGLMGDAAAPPWHRRDSQGDSRSGGSIVDEFNRVVATLRGLEVPSFPLAHAYALQAHSALPGLFVAAWDIALTPEGPVVLEGNTGFGTRVPQWISGGLFAGLRGAAASV